MELRKLTITQVHQGLMKKDFSALELAESFFERIKEEDKKVSAFLTLAEEAAFNQAREVDRLIAKGRKISPLAGVPFAVKDNILVEGLKTTCASQVLADYRAPYSATCVEKLKTLGAVILGKTNLDEFAMGSSTENSAFFATKNPFDLTRVAGGSSGGSAAAVADDMCVFALGSDTGGSIRQPAAFCGVFGLKPTYGAVSRYGLVAFASSLDQIGPLTKTAEDAKIILEAIQGKDPRDSTSAESKLPVSSESKSTSERVDFQFSKLKIGLPKEYFIEGIDSEVEKVIRETIKKCQRMGAEIKEISLPHAKYGLAVYYLIAPAEASSNLARYDGIKYGFSESGADLIDVYGKSRGQGFGAEVKRRIMLGTYILSAGYYDAYYLKAQKVRTLIKNDFERAFDEVDAIFTPTAPTPAFKTGEKIKDPLAMYLADVFTVSVNLAGLPAVSAPVGFAGSLPVGLQIIGKPFQERMILDIAEALISE
jgi:aspartyl-tRNA(Asn)/glutamyl-tRNA(Gln) amidotransferase subunit A